VTPAAPAEYVISDAIGPFRTELIPSLEHWDISRSRSWMTEE
jgi:hypothetical protein